MKIYCFILLLLSFFLFSCTSDIRPPILVSWEMGENRNEPREYDNVFYIKNISDSDLDNNWILYFSLMPAKRIDCTNSQIVVSQISSTHYKMYPSSGYKPLKKGEVLNVPLTFSGTLQKESMAPEGAYIVFLDKQGSEMNSMNIDITTNPFENDYQWSCEGKAELPYPDGNYVYAKNELFKNEIGTSVFDILPSVKKLKVGEDSIVIPSEVRIIADSSLANEVRIFKKRLRNNLNYTVNDIAQYSITLKVDGSVNTKNNESYTINTTADGITITGVSSHAIFNGIQTLIAILDNKNENLINEFSISDYPDLEYRGFMLDVARNFTSKDDLLKLINILSFYKLNQLHLHLTDDEGWRLEIPGLDELTQVGARRGHTLDERKCLYPAYGSGWDANSTFRGSGFYSKEDFIEILKYAHDRHIKVIPEIDLPAHARAAIVAMNARYDKYKDIDMFKAEEYLLADLNDKSVYRSAQGYIDNAVCVALPSVYKFVDKVISEIDLMYQEAGLKLEIMHLGGDEVPNGAWENSKISLDFMKRNNMQEIRDLKDYFVEQALTILEKRNIQMAAWQEIALLPDKTPNPRFSKRNILSYCWSTAPERKSEQIPYKLANSGYPIILSNVSNFYFDLAYNKHPNEPGAYWAGFVDEYRSFDMLPYRIYKSNRCDLYGNARDIQEDTKVKEALELSALKYIKGIQGQLWSETIRSYDMIEYFLFPKMFGLIERGWNANPVWQDDIDDNKYYKDLVKYNAKIEKNELPRLSRMGVNFRLSQAGIKIEKGKLYINSVYSDTELRYTTDETEPDKYSYLWTGPVDCTSEHIRAKQFYLGKESVTTIYRKK